MNREFDKFQFAAPQNDTERVRQGTKTDHVRHDLAAGPADKFQFYDQLIKTENLIPLLLESPRNATV